MKFRHILILALILAGLYGLTKMNSSSIRSFQERSEWKIGDEPFSDVPVNDAAQVNIERGDLEVTLSKKGNQWVVDSLFGYPADFGKLADGLRELLSKKVAEHFPDPEPFLEEFGLDPKSENPPTQLTVQDASGSSILDLAIGGTRTSSGPYAMPEPGQFVRLGSGDVVMLSENLSPLPADPMQWLKRDLLSIQENDIAYITVAQNGESYILEVKGPGDYTLDSLKKNEQLKNTEAGRVVRAMQNLQLTSIANPNENVSEEKPVAQYSVYLKDGREYTARLGDEVEQGNRRLMTLSAAFQPKGKPSLDEIAEQVTDENIKASEDGSLDEEQLSLDIQAAYETAVEEFTRHAAELRKKADEQNALFSRWTYEIMNFTADSMMIPRDKLVEKK